jgi:hypothetical protein
VYKARPPKFLASGLVDSVVLFPSLKLDLGLHAENARNIANKRAKGNRRFVFICLLIVFFGESHMDHTHSVYEA